MNISPLLLSVDDRNALVDCDVSNVLSLVVVDDCNVLVGFDACNACIDCWRRFPLFVEDFPLTSTLPLSLDDALEATIDPVLVSFWCMAA